MAATLSTDFKKREEKISCIAVQFGHARLKEFFFSHSLLPASAQKTCIPQKGFRIKELLPAAKYLDICLNI